MLSISAGIPWNILSVSGYKLCNLLFIVGFSFLLHCLDLTNCSCCCCLAVGSLCNWEIFDSNWGAVGKKGTLKTEGGGGKSGTSGDGGIVDHGRGNPLLLSSTMLSGKFLLNGFKLCSFWFNLIYFRFGTFFKNF